MSNNKNILLCDMGGTHARFAKYVSKGTYSDFKKYRLNDFKSFSDIIEKYIAQVGQSFQTARFACARAPVDGVIQYKRHAGDPDYLIDFNAIKTQFLWDDLTVLNDLSAGAYGLPLLSDTQTKIILKNNVQPWNDRKIIISVGTGVGHSGVHNNQILDTPGGHYFPPIITDEHKRLESFIRNNKDKNFALIIEDFVSGHGLRSITEFISNKSNNDLKPDEFINHLKHYPDAIRLFFEFLGIHANTITAATGYYGGVYLAGGVIDNLIINNLTDWKAFEKYFRPALVQSMTHRLNGTSVSYVTHDELPLLGLTS